MVSICCLTYNHEKFVEQCLNGLIMQEANFRYEILVHDDASTDETPKIIRDYERAYPNLIKPILQTVNQYSKGVSPMREILLPMAKGKYIALCEGDDYWIDPCKLKKQVAFLEEHSGYVMTSHRFKIYDQENNIWKDDGWGKYFPLGTQGINYDNEFVFNEHWISKTLSVVFRKEASYDYQNMSIPSRDTIMVYFLLKNGLGYCFNNVWGVYREHIGGVCSKIGKEEFYKTSFRMRKLLYDYDKNSFTKKNYLKAYCNYVIASEGKALFKGDFNFAGFFYLLFYIPRKLYITFFHD